MTPLPSFDAFAIVDGDVEPMGSHRALDAALAALGHFGEGGAVVVGLTAVRLHQDTDRAGREALRAALAPHGVRPRGGAPW